MQNVAAEPRHLTRVAVYWAIATVLGLAVVYFLGPLFPLPATASLRQSDGNLTLMVFTLVSVPVFMMVVVFAGYSLLHFRSNGRPTQDGPAVHGNTKLQTTWVIGSVVLVAFLLAWGLYYLYQADLVPQGNTLIVDVTGEQWNWNFTYPQYGNATTNELYLPVNRPVEFRIGSIDVQHSFWVPALGVKEDAVPGVINHIYVTPNVMGSYDVRCMELCGPYHSYMESKVQVISADLFQSTVTRLPTQAPNQMPPDPGTAS
jgi:cytochrome c oxidase subunit 2